MGSFYTPHFTLNSQEDYRNDNRCKKVQIIVEVVQWSF